MAIVFYWGEGGQHGPYHAQKDGWPHAGEVMRYFREKLDISPEIFAERYSEGLQKLGKQNKKGKKGKQGKVTGNWVLNMEKQNRVPTDIERHRLIADILHIPYELLGLASLNCVAMEPQKKTSPEAAGRGQVLPRISTNIATYQKNVRVALHLHRTSHAQGLLQDMNVDIEDLNSLERRAEGDLLYQVRELLMSNYLLATKIVKDQRHYAVAYLYAAKTIQIAKSMGDDELLATARYTRGCASLEWGLFGAVKQGEFDLDWSKIGEAMSDFQAIIKKEKAQPGTFHPQLYGLAMLQLSRAQAMCKQKQGDEQAINILTLIDQAADMIGREAIDDFYTRMTVTGTLSGLHLGGYLLVKAGVLNAVGLPGQALIEMNRIKQLSEKTQSSEKTYGQDETRNQAWIDIVKAEATIGLGEYAEATNQASSALISCHSIHSIQNIDMITDIHSRLSSSPYGTSRDVKELGDMLKEWYG